MDLNKPALDQAKQKESVETLVAYFKKNAGRLLILTNNRKRITDIFLNF